MYCYPVCVILHQTTKFCAGPNSKLADNKLNVAELIIIRLQNESLVGWGGIVELACLSFCTCVSLCIRLFVQNTSVCQSAGGSITLYQRQNYGLVQIESINLQMTTQKWPK